MPLYELRVYFAGEEHMLIEGGVEHAGGEQGDCGVVHAVGGEFAEGGEQRLAVMLDFLDAGVAVEAAQACLGDLAVGDHIGHAGGDAQVVFKHAKAVVCSDEVCAAYGDPDAVGG